MIAKLNAKKAKLITDGGFYKIIPIKEISLRINIPLVRTLRVATPELNSWEYNIHFECIFQFCGMKGGYAIYKQINVTSVIK